MGSLLSYTTYLTWFALSVPGLYLASLIAAHKLGANPVDRMLDFTGTTSLTLLLVALGITPLYRLSLISNPLRVKLRRLIGLGAFWYGLGHLCIYLYFDISLSMAELLKSVAKRPYITAGFSALLILLALALTSGRRRLGLSRQAWDRLHRMVYPAASLAVIHFYMMQKADVRLPVIYGMVFLVLLSLRLIPARLKRGA